MIVCKGAAEAMKEMKVEVRVKLEEVRVRVQMLVLEQASWQ